MHFWHHLCLFRSSQTLSKKVCTAGPIWLRPADSSPGHQLGRVGPQGVGRVSLVYGPRLMPNGGASVGSVQKGLSIGTLASIPSPSLKPHNPASPPMRGGSTLRSFHLPEPKVSGHERDFVCWPFKRALRFLTDSCLSLVDEIPTDFHSQISYGLLFLTLVLWAWEPRIQLRPLTFKGRPLQLS